jgi:transposase
MGQVSTIGLDLAKSIFQVHGADASGAVVIRKCLSEIISKGEWAFSTGG